MWRSLVARFVRDEEAAGSNPVTPTTKNPGLFPWVLLLIGYVCGQDLGGERRKAFDGSCHPDNKEPRVVPLGSFVDRIWVCPSF